MKLFLKIAATLGVLYILAGVQLALFFGANSIDTWANLIFRWPFVLFSVSNLI
jgi:hypothetical protein